MSEATPAYRCWRCDCRLWWEYGEWGCACWAVRAADLAAGGAALPEAWTPLDRGPGPALDAREGERHA